MISENKRNGSGYYDPTAYMAMMNVRKEGENKMEVCITPGSDPDQSVWKDY